MRLNAFLKVFGRSGSAPLPFLSWTDRGVEGLPVGGLELRLGQVLDHGRGVEVSQAVVGGAHAIPAGRGTAGKHAAQRQLTWHDAV